MPALAPVIRTMRSVWSGMSKGVHRAGTAALLAANTDSPLPLRGTADHGCSTARVDDMAATGPDCCAAASQPVTELNRPERRCSQVIQGDHVVTAGPGRGLDPEAQRRQPRSPLSRRRLPDGLGG